MGPHNGGLRLMCRRLLCNVSAARSPRLATSVSASNGLFSEREGIFFDDESQSVHWFPGGG